MIIGCDIGGVVKEMTSDQPIENALETMKELELNGHRIIFISKCKENFRKVITEWLQKNNLTNQIYFCNEYSEKCKLCIDTKTNYMIDDKLQVFRDIPDSIVKIWLCSDEKKISGAYKYQPEEVKRVTICNSWLQIKEVI